MKLSKNNGTFVLECSNDELTILVNALNNIPQAVDDCEYTTLIGATKEETEALLAALVKATA